MKRSWSCERLVHFCQFDIVSTTNIDVISKIKTYLIHHLHHNIVQQKLIRLYAKQ